MEINRTLALQVWELEVRDITYSATRTGYPRWVHGDIGWCEIDAPEVTAYYKLVYELRNKDWNSILHIPGEAK